RCGHVGDTHRTGCRPIAPPQPTGNREEQCAVHACQLRRIRTEFALDDVRDAHRPLGRPIRLPQLEASAPIVGCKEEGAVHLRRSRPPRPVATAPERRTKARVDVPDEYGPGRGSIALPQLDSVTPMIVRPEKKCAARLRQMERIRAAYTGADVFHEN